MRMAKKIEWKLERMNYSWMDIEMRTLACKDAEREGKLRKRR